MSATQPLKATGTVSTTQPNTTIVETSATQPLITTRSISATKSHTTATSKSTSTTAKPSTIGMPPNITRTRTFGRRPFGRRHMSERNLGIGKPEFQLLFHQRIIFTNLTFSWGVLILINTTHIKRKFFALIQLLFQQSRHQYNSHTIRIHYRHPASSSVKVVIFSSIHCARSKNT